MNNFFFAISLVTIATLNFSCESKSKNKIRTSRTEYLPVTKIVDGDTFWADDGSEKGLKIRLIGVDAPESRNVFKKKKGYYGMEAKAYLTKMLNGKSIKLVRDVDSLDRFGRTLSYVYLEDGTFVNAELVKNGYAMIMTIPPNVEFADLFLKLQIEARENSTGLWKE
jgi:micrococcal nuclease